VRVTHCLERLMSALEIRCSQYREACALYGLLICFERHMSALENWASNNYGINQDCGPLVSLTRKSEYLVIGYWSSVL
jgi:hypothetical protein